MTPYYSDDFATIYHGNSMDILPQIERGSVTAVVTDPPYVIGAVSAGNMASKAGGWADMMNSALWFTAWYREVDRVLHRRGSFWTFCNWRSLPVVMRAAIDTGLPVTSMLVWDKEWIGPGGQQGLRPSYELCALMAQTKHSKVVPTPSVSVAEGYCPVMDDHTHCVHWWDDEGPCCACGDDSGAGESDVERE